MEKPRTTSTGLVDCCSAGAAPSDAAAIANFDGDDDDEVNVRGRFVGLPPQQQVDGSSLSPAADGLSEVAVADMASTSALTVDIDGGSGPTTPETV